MIKKSLIALLEAESDVTDIVGSRIYVNRIPQGFSLIGNPTLLLSTTAVTRIYSNDGNVGIPTATVSVDCFADTYLEAITLADYVRLCLESYAGTVGGMVIQAIFLNGQQDLSGNVEPGSDICIHRIGLDFEVHYQEDIA